MRAEVPVPHGERSNQPGWIAIACRASAPSDPGAMNSTWWQWSTPLDLGWRGGALLVDRVHDREPGVEDLLLPVAVERQADVVEVDHGVEVAAEREAVRDLAEPGTSTVASSRRT